MAGLTYWDVPNLETLHQVRLPGGPCVPPRPRPVLAPAGVNPATAPCSQKALSCTLQMLSLGRSNRATAATAMNQHSSRSHALVTLTLRAASPLRGSGTAGTIACVPPCGGPRHTGDWAPPPRGFARPCRHAAPGGPGWIRACLEGGGGLLGARRS